jgi:hypothetical protein
MAFSPILTGLLTFLPKYLPDRASAVFTYLPNRAFDVVLVDLKCVFNRSLNLTLSCCVITTDASASKRLPVFGIRDSTIFFLESHLIFICLQRLSCKCFLLSFFSQLRGLRTDNFSGSGTRPVPLKWTCETEVFSAGHFKVNDFISIYL